MVNLEDTKGDDWDHMAKVYKQLSLGVSSKPITVMLERSNAAHPFSEATGIHDSGCGPGSVISQIISDYGNSLPMDCTLSASDFSPAMVEQVEKTRKSELEADSGSIWARLEPAIQDAMDLQLIGDGSKSHVTAGFVYFMTPDPMKCLLESKRVLKDGGVLACSSWKSSQWMELMLLVLKVREDAQLPLLPAEWRTVEAIKAELRKAGFRHVESHEVDVEMSFDSHDTLVDVLIKLPHMVVLTEGWDREEMEKLRHLMLQEAKEYCMSAPGILEGTALVAIGRK